MKTTIFAHNDIDEAAKFYKIPLAFWSKDDVYLMQEDRCVFVGKPKIAEQFIKNNNEKICKSVFPL